MDGLSPDSPTDEQNEEAAAERHPYSVAVPGTAAQSCSALFTKME